MSAELNHVKEGSSKDLSGESWAEGSQGGPYHSPRCLSLQFRENVQDVLPALPNPDDYFLLRWLRGEGRGAVGGCGRGLFWATEWHPLKTLPLAIGASGVSNL